MHSSFACTHTYNMYTPYYMHTKHVVSRQWILQVSRHAIYFRATIIACLPDWMLLPVAFFRCGEKYREISSSFVRLLRRTATTTINRKWVRALPRQEGAVVSQPALPMGCATPKGCLLINEARDAHDLNRDISGPTAGKTCLHAWKGSKYHPHFVKAGYREYR